MRSIRRVLLTLNVEKFSLLEKKQNKKLLLHVFRYELRSIFISNSFPHSNVRPTFVTLFGFVSKTFLGTNWFWKEKWSLIDTYRITNATFLFYPGIVGRVGQLPEGSSLITLKYKYIIVIIGVVINSTIMKFTCWICNILYYINIR